MRNQPNTTRGLLAVTFVVATAGVTWAQLGSSTTSPPPLVGTPGMTAVPPATVPGPTSTLQQPTFDPYSTQPNAATMPPSLLPPPPGTSGLGATTPGLGQPYPSTQPPYNPYPYSPAPYGAYGQPAAPGFGVQNPPVLFPHGLFGGQGQSPGGQPLGVGGALKLFQHVQASHTWLLGTSGDELCINDSFVELTAAFPNFLWSGQPWFVSPGFGLHLWSGPWDALSGPPDGVLPGFQGAHALPSRAFSAFLDVGWQSDPNRIFGAELGGRIGLFTDFAHFDSNGVRLMGLALMRYNLTPTLALKAGVSYINRADIKLLPAGGIVWTPNPQTRWDIFFPQPKLACYLTTLGNYDLWWYVSGEYGGGTWSLRRWRDVNGNGQKDFGETDNDLMDINDIRVMLGIDIGPPGTSSVGHRGAFFEVGYVWNREVVFVLRPEDSFTPASTLMLRGGFAF